LRAPDDRSADHAVSPVSNGGQDRHEPVTSEDKQDLMPIAHGPDGEVMEIVIGPIRPLLAAAARS
jgi:hypothetical protein